MPAKHGAAVVSLSVGREALESSSPGLQPGATPSQLPAQKSRANKHAINEKTRCRVRHRVLIHQGSAGARGAPSDMEIHLREVLSTTKRMAQIIAHHSGRPLEQVQRDIDRDYYMTAEAARDYGEVLIGFLRGVERPEAVSAGRLPLEEESGQSADRSCFSTR